MRNERLIELSLQRTHVERLVICLGYVDQRMRACRGAVATRTAHLLLQQCKPAASDVHDPSVTRARGRDIHGRPRPYYGVGCGGGRTPHTGAVHRPVRYAYSRLRTGRGTSADAAGAGRQRSPQVWDSQPVPDFMGLWCDRLLLGDFQQPRRCALFVPHVPPALYGEAVTRVAQSHRVLRQDDVLIIAASDKLPLGVLRQVHGLQTSPCTTTATMTASTATSTTDVASIGAAPLLASASSSSPCMVLSNSSLADAMSCFASSSSPSPRQCTVLHIGIGTAAAPRARFDAEEETRLTDVLVPLSAFVAALWATNADASARYAQQMTPTPQHLTRASANVRLWRTMQAAMLSTRDAAVLRAYAQDTLLDARLCKRHTTYLAETLLRRLAAQPDVFAPGVA